MDSRAFVDERQKTVVHSVRERIVGLETSRDHLPFEKRVFC
jgi:hypothetical protein